MTRTLRFILGDQLSRSISSLDGLDKDADVVLIAEVMEEALYVRHHKRKIAFLFSAMRHFAEALRAEGVTVDYRRLDEEDGARDFTTALSDAIARHQPEQVIVTEPGEYRVLAMMRDWAETMPVPVLIREDSRFICPPDIFARWAERQKSGLTMEYFYREMRRRTGLLMEGDKPVGGAWNFDAENRKPLPARMDLPARPAFAPDAVSEDVLRLVEARFGEHFGSLADFAYPVTAEDAERALDWFIENALPLYGDYQDAMRQGAPLLFHSNLSALINAGLLDPLDCCRRAEAAFRAGAAPLNAVEGFIRQIIGWREYVRGVYWLKMPGYGELNALEARRELPWFFWSAETEMNCLAQAIGETRDHAYAHHIQRLMVIGNFALLAGLDPRQVQEWYLVVYHDAYEWVEMPNVVGMILHADGGYLASKPYAASGAYIDRMSDYCRGCRYDVKAKAGPDACPFNYLYWDFIARHRERFARNHRMGVVLKNYERMSAERKAEIESDAARFLGALR
ncbi:cryptochrome/photolyase family protein [Arsenicitalea aurantiaca]|uniref:Cryptochrome/photolyase family protein n=1 Tax=Arsenicitalea aurantiaca TaxID=1783274 RepID=A0A433X3D4_9HYPH|nr:cryptochrome/photolyase family protein [Arsenicitalea aurantiaca]RUT28578.1 cryptochrome/photolyase family protein [Arsenicitalea aurantiaca]